MVKKVVLTILGLVISVLIAGFLLVFFNSPGKMESLKNDEGQTIQGSINEKKFIRIGGIKQGMFIRGEDRSKPILLFLHGGPGTPEFAMSEAWETQDRLEKEFVVCYWDQRGTGMSNTKELDKKTVTKNQAIEDTVEVTYYLRQRFKQDKIFLIGHSWGGYVGIKTVQKNPELYLAYMGIGQPVHQKKGQKLAYDYLRNHAKKIGDKKSLEKLATFDPEGSAYNLLLEKYGVGIRHKGQSMLVLIKNLMFFKGYTLTEKVNAFKGMALSNEKLDNEEYSNDNILKSIPELEVPVYGLHGKYDHQVSYQLAKEFFAKVEAPEKKFYTFNDSAHSPNFEEPKAFLKAVKEIKSQVEKSTFIFEGEESHE